MSDQDPYQHDPYDADPYTSDPYVPGADPYPSQPRPGDPTTPIPTSMPAQPPGPYPASGYPPPGYPPPGYPPYGYPPPQPTNVSALILTILSGILALSCYCTLPGVVSLVFGILGLTKQQTDPDEAAKLTKYGWIAFASLMALSAIGWIAFFVLAIAADSTSTY